MVRVAPLLLAIAACISPSPAPKGPRTATARGPAIAKIGPDAAELLEAWATAIGGRDGLDALGALHGKGSYEKGGMRGTIELWVSPRGERREEIVLGPLRELRVFDGTQGWLVERNKEVRELAGIELDDQKTLAFREVYAALLVDRRPGAVTRDADKLVLAAEGSARPETVTFDRATGLPETFVRRDGEKHKTVRLSDWNFVGNSKLKLPFTMREETG